MSLRGIHIYIFNALFRARKRLHVEKNRMFWYNDIYPLFQEVVEAAVAAAAVLCDNTKSNAENRAAEAARRAAVVVPEVAVAVGAVARAVAPPAAVRRLAARPIAPATSPSRKIAERWPFA